MNKHQRKNVLKWVTMFTLVLLIVLSLVFGKSYYKKVGESVIGLYYVYEGDKAYKKRDMQQAIDYYEEGLRLFPHHFEAWYNLGNLYVVYEDYYAASFAYSNAILRNKKYTRARMNLGIINAEKLGDFDEAIKQYQAIISANKKGIIIPFIFNSIESEKYNRAIAYYNKGLAYSKKAFYVDDKKDELRLKRKYLYDAAEAYENALKLLGSDYDTSYNLALTYHLVGDYKKAGLNYCKTIETAPMHYEAHYNLAILLKKLKQYELAADELEKATLLATTTSINKSEYIINVLSGVSQILVREAVSKELPDENTPVSLAALDNGKIGYTEELDTLVLESFRNCKSKPYFEAQ